MNFKQSTRRWLGQSIFAGLFAVLALPAIGQEYPQRPISLVVPFSPGGSLDATARFLSEKLKDILGQPVLVLNRPGAGSSVGARAVAGSPPDGYTLFFTSGSAYGYLSMLIPSYDLGLDDFTSVAAVASNPSVIAVRADLPVKTLGELVEYAHNKPGEISFCSTGVGGLNHLQLEMFKRVVKAKTGKDFDVTHIPYNGLAPALVDMKAKNVQACTLPYTALVKNLDGKDLRILAIQRKSRAPSLPNTPTTGEQGFPELDSNDAYVNIAAPKGTPQAVVAKLEAAIKLALQDPGVQKKLEGLDVESVFMNSSDTRKWLEDDVKKFGGVIREAGLMLKK